MVEVMISIALMLVLMIGINQVFKATGQAIGAGNAVASAARDTRETAATIFEDLNHISPDSPLLFINETAVAQYKNQADFIANAYGANPLYRTDIGGPVSLLLDSDRGHYASTMGFFATGNFPRRTTPDSSLFPTANGAAQDAFIWLGHLALPADSALNKLNNKLNNDPTGSFAGPQDFSSGIDPNAVEGYFAADWVLGRQATLLSGSAYVSDKTSALVPADPGFNYPNTGFSAFGPSMPPANTIQPLGSNVPLPVGTTPPLLNAYSIATSAQSQWLSQNSRCDLAAVTLDQMRNTIRDNIAWDSSYGPFGSTPTPAKSFTAPWWTPFVFSAPWSLTIPYTTMSPILPNYNFTASSLSALPSPMRYQMNTLYQTPVDAAAMARVSPYLLGHASQFIVEYAGDYVAQDDSGVQSGVAGSLKGLGPDGTLDYFYDATGTKRIRWYGLPRYDTAVPHNPTGTPPPPGAVGTITGAGSSGAGISGAKLGPNNTVITSIFPVTAGTSVQNATNFPDVIPLRDFQYMWLSLIGGSSLPTATLQTNSVSPFLYQPYGPERFVNFTVQSDYASTFQSSATWAAAIPNYPLALPGAIPPDPMYTCVFTPNNMPWMIRILVKVDDPNGQLAGGPWFEYIFTLRK